MRPLVAAARCLAVAALAAAAPARADDTRTFTDPAGDAVIRRTDAGNAGPLGPGAALPDLLSVRLSGWLPWTTYPSTDPYTGATVGAENAHLFRVDMVLAGVVCPPGPLGLGGEPHDPFRHGPSPVYGFIEFDVDRDRDTGGELGGAANTRFLANAGRFGGIPSGSIGERAARGASDCDYDFYTAPYLERSGEDFSLVLCGCSAATVVFEGGNGDHRFGPGETWIVRGRFFQRAAGYKDASAMSGGSDFGLYDPLVNLRFSHDLATDRTTVSLVFPLDMQGAAMLLGGPQQPVNTVIDTGGDHASLLEAVLDLVNGARGLNGGPLVGPVLTLTDGWRYPDLDEALDCTRWRATALVGTAYAAPMPALYVWTDIGFECTVGDQDGDGAIAPADRQAVEGAIMASDGTAEDADGTVNGEYALPNFAANFSPLDLNGDGIIGAQDLAAYLPPPCAGDWDHDGVVAPADVGLFVNNWFTDLGGGTLITDIDHDGLVAPADVSRFVSIWFGCLH